MLYGIQLDWAHEAYQMSSLEGYNIETRSYSGICLSFSDVYIMSQLKLCRHRRSLDPCNDVPRTYTRHEHPFTLLGTRLTEHGHPISALPVRRANVRQYDTLWLQDQRMICRDIGFAVDDVETGRKDLRLSQCTGKCVGVDDGSLKTA